ncbi:DUF4136 domain-containing protein [Myxococcus xanthus]|uniref:DUF4136 domain-containing protein n=1 Tax=Myxococcus xanthus TaxID=34 RepID=A0A7Y4MTL2_MYXXA|nr:DUF4136 domain-containing protein [Myxococcus xanthus]NOJ81672.1 DUF4136 domain-containing protein [Myxococcus xanthus]NOJ89648.1 DUF4136 domain-containing protein [Myxococcus xanthus]
MRLLTRIAPPLLALAVAACSSIDVNTNYDPTATQKLEGYRTYAWLPQPTGKDDRVYNPIIGARVEQTVDRYLQARGYQKVESTANPDFLIGWHGAIHNALRAETVDAYYGYPWGGPFTDPFFAGGAVTMPETELREYEEGSLILDVVDPQTKQLVWRGTAQAELDENASAEKQQRRLDESVKDVLERFPPKTK